MWFLIGSQAVKTLRKEFYRNIENSDLDIYCSREDFLNFLTGNKNIEKCFPLKHNKYRLKVKNYPIIELKVYDTNSVYHWLSLEQQKELIESKKYTLDNIELNIPNIQCLTAIKESHLYWPIHWLKNIEDFHWLKEHSLKRNEKENIFAHKIKKEMKNLHGSIPYGKFNQLNINEWREEIKNIKTYDTYEKNMFFFIHFKLSLKNKLKVIKSNFLYQQLKFQNNFKNKL